MPKSKKANENKIVVYQAKTGAIELRGDLEKETFWATQAQIADIFGVERSVVTKHIKNILSNKEVNEKSNVQKMHIANSDKPVALYSLDIMLAVGYRTNSKRAIEFRRWSTKILHDHITKGFTINKKNISHNYNTFMKAVTDIQAFVWTYFATFEKIDL
ncbi:virulence RhuM family protein [Patescibacteria group bacterium]|nr:virulence RhuM family protein [Patescibacteria group bacterium]MCG2687452.1 virulence RhuM family protein [Candidatus Parcubacteria bacterium]